VQRKSSLEVGINENPKKLQDFINGKRDSGTAWVD
jgi:hypothetical protein